MPEAKTRIVKMPASALEDADVQFISLVNRPANRIPYRIMKAEDITVSKEETESRMFNLSNLSTMLRSKTDADQTGPAVAAVVIRKADADALIPKLKEQGVIVENATEQDDVVILKQSDFEEDKVTTFKLNDDILMLVTDVQKAFEPFADTTDFEENAQVSGFMPGLHMATEALFDTYRNILIESKTKDEAATLMKSAIDSYASLVTSMADNLPEMAFKLEELAAKSLADEVADAPVVELEGAEAEAAAEEQAATEAAQKDDEEGAGDAVADTEATAEGETETAEKADEKITEAVAGDHEDGLGETETAAKSDDEGADDKSESAVKDDTEEKDDEPDMAAVLASFKSEIMEGITGVQTELSAVKETADSLKDRLDDVEEVAKAANEAVRGTVQSGSDDVRDESLGTHSRTQKSSDDDELWGGVDALDKIVSG